MLSSDILPYVDSKPHVNIPSNVTNGSFDKKLKVQTDKFEAIFIKQMLDIAMQAKSGFMPKGTGAKLYTSMYTDTMANHLSGQMGLSEMVYKYLKEQ